MLGSALISALNGALAKVLSDDMSAMEIVFFRNIIGVALILFALKHTPPKLNGGKLHLLFIRGLFGFSAMILFFYTITVIPLGEAITLNKTSPLFVSVLAYYLLREHLSKRTIAALLIGFFGVVLIAKPFDLSVSYEHVLGILGGFFAAAAYATIKKIKDIYDSRVIVLSFVGVGTLLPALFSRWLHTRTRQTRSRFCFLNFSFQILFVCGRLSRLWLLRRRSLNGCSQRRIARQTLA